MLYSYTAVALCHLHIIFRYLPFLPTTPSPRDQGTGMDILYEGQSNNAHERHPEDLLMEPKWAEV